MSTEHGFNKSCSLLLNCGFYHPKPLFYPRNSNEIIISTDAVDNNAGIFKYNINTNKLELIHEYDTFQPECHGHFIDYKNKILYMFGGDQDTYSTFNLKTKEITDTTSDNSGAYVKSVVIPSTNQIHILKQDKTHFMFDCNKKIFRKIDCNCNALLNSKIAYWKLIYCEYNNKLMILGGDENDEIFYCNIQSQNVEMEWKLNNKIKMPHIVEDETFYDVIVFRDVIIVFYFSDDGYNDIWCLDLLSEKWFESKYNVPKIGCKSYFIKNNNNNNIHILDFHNQNHFTIDIYHLFPNELIKLRRKHYNKLVIGFIKQQQNNKIIPIIPFVLKNLISYYFPLFG